MTRPLRRTVLPAALTLALAASGHASALRAAPPRAQVVAGLQARLSPGAGGRLDAAAMIAAARDSALSPAAGAAQVYTSASLMQAMADPASMGAMELRLDADSKARLKEVALEVSRDPVLQAALQQAIEAIKGRVDESKLAKLWDGGARSAAGAEEAVPVQDVRVAPAATLDMATARVKTARRPPPSPMAEMLVAEPSNLPAELKPAPDEEVGVLSARERKQVDKWVAALMRLDPSDLDQRRQGKGAAATYGLELQRRALDESKLLRRRLGPMKDDPKSPSKTMALRLFELQRTLDGLNPSKVNLRPGKVRQMVSKLPMVGTPLQRYAAKFNTKRESINGMVTSLTQARDQVIGTTDLLEEDAHRLRGVAHELRQTIASARAVARELIVRIEQPGNGLSAERRSFLREEVLYHLLTNIRNLQTQAMVNQQGATAVAIAIRNNEIGIQNVNSSIHTVTPALEVGALIAEGLEEQRQLHLMTQAYNRTGALVIEGNALLAKEQGEAIQKAAREGTIDAGVFERAAVSLRTAIEGLNTFHQTAVPQIMANIESNDKLIAEAELTLRRFEDSSAARRLQGETPATPKRITGQEKP